MNNIIRVYHAQQGRGDSGVELYQSDMASYLRTLLAKLLLPLLLASVAAAVPSKCKSVFVLFMSTGTCIMVREV